MNLNEKLYYYFILNFVCFKQKLAIIYVIEKFAN